MQKPRFGGAFSLLMAGRFFAAVGRPPLEPSGFDEIEAGALDI
jgi:hypothetical protein